MSNKIFGLDRMSEDQAFKYQMLLNGCTAMLAKWCATTGLTQDEVSDDRSSYNLTQICDPEAWEDIVNVQIPRGKYVGIMTRPPGLGVEVTPENMMGMLLIVASPFQRLPDLLNDMDLTDREWWVLYTLEISAPNTIDVTINYSPDADVSVIVRAVLDATWHQFPDFN